MKGEQRKYHHPALDDEITLYLRRNSMRQAELATMMGMTENTFSWKRRGVRDFTLGEAIMLCNILNIELRDAVVAS